ncbi:hypothetical protein KFE25_003637 [Diacronema lutheri]|uniref:Protein kinase domain-containing protein n=1 Tax=Diacronema lutheri TaxID=2081491 RepID=A0A8J5XCE3_DIALT|nr:hypothetical protein KFE25_003637 [Diacronema lutheri]
MDIPPRRSVTDLNSGMRHLSLAHGTPSKGAAVAGFTRKARKSMPLLDAGVQPKGALPSLGQTGAHSPGDLDLTEDECTQLATELKDSSWKSVGKATHMNGVASGLSAGTGADDGGECAPHAQLAPHAAAAERFDSLYDVGAVLGKGTYGSVRLARHRETRQECAVKIIDKLSAESSLEDLAREIAMLADLQHPNIIRLIAAYESHSHVYVVTELASGGELMHRISQEHSVYSEQEVQRHTFTVLQAIDFMHAKGIVHRDLKPENILLSDKSDSATIKVVDFGLSQYTRTDQPSLLQTVCGTHKYLSPEMILCDRGRLRGYSKAVDMWGVGIILYVMLFGFNPFEARTRGETHEAILRCKYTFPADTNASAQVKDLISHLLTREYQKRYTVQECLAHPWFNNAASQASAEPLVSSKKSVRERLAEFNAQRSSVYEKVKSVHRRLSNAGRSSRTSM